MLEGWKCMHQISSSENHVNVQNKYSNNYASLDFYCYKIKIRIQRHISITAMESNVNLTEEIIPISNTDFFSLALFYSIDLF